MPTRRLASAITSVVTQGAWSSIGNRLPFSPPFASAVHTPEVREPLMGALQTTKVRDFLDRARATDFMQSCRQFEDLFGNGHFDPNRPYQLNSYYVKTQTFEDLDTIVEYARNRNLKRNIVLVGPKGAGKTATQNCWLSQRRAQLEENRILWVRCDGHRLYNIWHKDGVSQDGNTRIDYRQLVTLEEYLNLKLVYVLAKHGRDSREGLLGAIVNEIADSNPTFPNPVGRHKEAYELAHVRSRLDEIAQTILRVESANRPIDLPIGTAPTLGGAGWRYLEDSVIPTSHRTRQREKNQWLALSLAIQRVLQEMDVFLLQMVDGLDNVHTGSEHWQPYYDHMLRQAAMLMGHDPGRWKMVMLTFRLRTFIESRRRQDHPAGATGQIDINRIEIVPASPHAVYQGRYEHLRGALQVGGETLFLRIAKAVLALTSEEPLAAYNYDHRTFLHNRLTLVRQVYYRLVQRENLGADDAAIEAQVRRLHRRNLLLNDRLFLDTEADWYDLRQELGSCGFNLFNMHSAEARVHEGSVWWGLCAARILLLLEGNNGVEQEVLQEHLHVGWNYPIGLISAYVEALRAFGMVNTIEEGPLGPVTLAPSESGRLFLKRSFTDVDTLYYCALDSPVPLGLVRGQYFKGHCNKLGRPTGYRQAAVSTAFSFMCFIGRVAEEEMLGFRMRAAGLTGRAGGLVPCVVLPHESAEGRKALDESFKRALDGLEVEDSRELEDFFFGKLALKKRAEDVTPGVYI